MEVATDKKYGPNGSGFRLVWHFGRRYWRQGMLILLSMMIYAAGVNGRAYLIKPFLEEVILPAEELNSDVISGNPVESILQGGTLSPEERQRQQASLRRAIEQRLLPLLGIALLVITFIPLANFLRSYLGAWVVNRMILDMQADLCRIYLQLPLAFHNRQRKGDLLARLNSDVANASLSFKLLYGDLVQEPITLVVGVGVLLYLNWQLTVLLALILPPLILLIVRFGRRIRKKSRRRQEEISHLLGAMVQMFSGIKVVKAFQKEDFEWDRFQRQNRQVFRRTMKVVKTEVTSHSVTELFNNVTYILFLGIGVFAIIQSALGLTFPVLVAFLALAPTLYRPVKHLSQAYNQFSDAMAGLDRVAEILNQDPGDLADEGSRELQFIREGIRFEAVDFAYGESDWMLREINLTIRPGETVALVGKTGAGKTTLSDLLLRLYDPTRGRILIDGVDIRQYSRASLLARMAVVTQEPFLFDATVAENIRYGKADAPMAEIEAAARAAFIHDAITALPDGYDTRVGDRGVRLSGGERQRVTMARALLKDPAILILDEATSSLDAQSERQIQRALENLMRGRTTLVIAHRFSTILHADRIAVLDGGRLLMTGSHEELLRECPLYQELYALQFLPQGDTRRPATDGL
ncbi:MAG: ABC transporter ATP-binding protein [Acidobacteria bacterium]|nr:ABC transporter ATP-binding protein [Acidobacteriota bacterium]